MPPLFEAASGITEITGALDIDIGDAFSSPSNMTKAVSKSLDKIVPGDWDSEIKSKMDRMLGIYDLDEYSATGRDSIKQGVTILPTDQPRSRMAMEFFNPVGSKVGADLNITEVEYDFPSIADISYALAQGEDIPGPEREESITQKPILSPFSLYYPSVAWPYMTDEGKRYTVVDLGNEPIDLPAGDWIGWLMGRKLDRVGAIPGFRFWGDPLLGVSAATPTILVSIPILLTAPYWGPPLLQSLGISGKRAFEGSMEILGAVGRGVAATGKALVKPIRGLGSVSISG